MIFASFHRLISVSTRTATQTVLVRNISTIFLSRKSFDGLDRTFEVPSVLCATAIRNNSIKRRLSQQSGGLNVAEQNVSASSIKRRPLRKKRLISEDLESAQPGVRLFQAISIFPRNLQFLHYCFYNHAKFSSSGMSKLSQLQKITI